MYDPKDDQKPRLSEAEYQKLERDWRAKVGTERRRFSSANTIILILVLFALFLVAWLNRVRIGAFWQQVTGKAPPLFMMPEKPEREGPEIEGRDF